MTALQTFTITYNPRPIQAELHVQLRRFNVLVLHRRFGKTVMCIMELIDKAINHKRPGPALRYAYVAPTFKQAKLIAWDYLQEFTRAIPGIKFNQTELRVDFPWGARITLFGADNPDAIRGIFLDGAVLDEFAQMSDEIWSKVIRPLLTDYNGWAIFIGTPQGEDHFKAKYDFALDPANADWFAAKHKASETGLIPEDELLGATLDMGEDAADQEFECNFYAALKGAYYGRQFKKLDAAGRVGDVSYDPALLVHTSWDLGISDYTTIWFVQVSGTEVRIIDYYENNGEGLDHYARVLKEKPYVYADHLFPHDVKVRELSTGISRAETLNNLGIYPTILPKIGVEDGIQMARRLLAKCWFNEATTRAGVSSLRQYRIEYDAKLGTARKTPRHDRHSHAADSFRYLAMGLRLENNVNVPTTADRSYNPLAPFGVSPTSVNSLQDAWGRPIPDPNSDPSGLPYIFTPGPAATRGKSAF